MTTNHLSNQTATFHQLIHDMIRNGNLVRLYIVKSRGVRFNLPARLLNFDEEQRTLSVYHVDEKQVYLFNLNEIEDMIY